MNTNFTNLVNEQISPIINIESIKDSESKAQSANLTSFEHGLIYAQSVQKLRELINSATFKQIAKESYQISESAEFYYLNLLGISKQYVSKLGKIAKASESDINTYKQAQKDKNKPLSLDTFHSFLINKDKPESEPKEESKEAKIEKAKKFLEKLGLTIDDLK